MTVVVGVVVVVAVVVLVVVVVVEQSVFLCCSNTFDTASLEKEAVPVQPELHVTEAPEVRAGERGVQHRAGGDRAP